MWRSYLMETRIARSTKETEFITLELAGQQAECLKGLLADMPLWEREPAAISLHCES